MIPTLAGTRARFYWVSKCRFGPVSQFIMEKAIHTALIFGRRAETPKVTSREAESWQTKRIPVKISLYGAMTQSVFRALVIKKDLIVGRFFGCIHLPLTENNFINLTA